MQLDIPLDSLAATAAARVALAAGQTQVWPVEQPLQEIADPRILGTRFQDAALVHPQALAAISAAAREQPVNFHGWGGKKVRDAAVWDLPELQLLTRRALLFYCRASRLASAHVSDRWANVLEHGDYSTPHCHYDAEVAVVYALDPGDEVAEAPGSGRLEIIDPRIEFCCSRRPGYPSRGILPALEPGTMLLFPASFLHYVKPYCGRRARVTLAWNLNPGPAPADLSAQFERQATGVFESGAP